MFSPLALNVDVFSGCVVQHSDVTIRGQTAPALSIILLFLGCCTYHCSLLVVIVSSSFSGGECITLTWRLVAMAIQGAVAVATDFL